MGARTFTPPIAGVTTCTSHEISGVSGDHLSLSPTVDMASALGAIRCIFVSATNITPAIASLTDSDGHTYAVGVTPTAAGSAVLEAIAAQWRRKMAGPVPVPMPVGVLCTAAVPSARARGAVLTIRFASPVTDPIIVVQHWMA